jgi:hypothetical protein
MAKVIDARNKFKKPKYLSIEEIGVAANKMYMLSNQTLVALNRLEAGLVTISNSMQGIIESHSKAVERVARDLKDTNEKIDFINEHGLAAYHEKYC